MSPTSYKLNKREVTQMTWYIGLFGIFGVIVGYGVISRIIFLICVKFRIDDDDYSEGYDMGTIAFMFMAFWPIAIPVSILWYLAKGIIIGITTALVKIVDGIFHGIEKAFKKLIKAMIKEAQDD